MGYEVHPEKGWVNRGNLYRMKELMRRAGQGDRMTLAFLGGSITQGSVSTQYTNCYAYRVYEWFVRRFPKTAFTYVNAGVGGTTSNSVSPEWKRTCCCINLILSLLSFR